MKKLVDSVNFGIKIVNNIPIPNSIKKWINVRKNIVIDSKLELMLSDIIRKYTIQYNTIQYNTIQYNTIQYNTIRFGFFGGKVWRKLL